jgi:hypothetical protein
MAGTVLGNKDGRVKAPRELIPWSAGKTAQQLRWLRVGGLARVVASGTNELTGGVPWTVRA